MSKIKLEIEMEELSYRATLEYKKLSCINDNDLTEMILNAKPVKEYDDCISRQATLNKAFEIKTGENTSAMVVYAEDIRKELPVLPKREQGEWIIERDCEGKTRICICPKCGEKTGKYTWKNPNYCSNCGMEMIQSQESEETNDKDI